MTYKSSTNRNEKAEFYRAHVLQAKAFPGPTSEYIKQNGLSAGTFYFHKKQIGLNNPKTKKAFIRIDPTAQAPRNESRSGPDPIWLAKFIKSLFLDA
jgi:hypothetical protein